MLRQLKWVSLTQLVSFVIPVALMPILAHRLGVGGFASFAVLAGISQYSTLGVELGLNFAGLSELKRCTSDAQHSTIFTEIFLLKCLLALLMIFIVTGSVAASPLARIVSVPQFAFLLTGSLGTCLIFPAWYFVLKNRLDINFKITLGSRFALVVTCLLVIKEPSDYLKAVALFNFAMLPIACIYSPEWIFNIRSPFTLLRSAVSKRLLTGLQLSGATLRETITNIGVAPLYGLFAFEPSIGVFAFAEKMAKILTAPAPLVTSVVLSATSNETRSLGVFGKWSRVNAWLILPGFIATYAALAVVINALVRNFFPQFKSSAALVITLIGVSPVVYFNYLEIAIRYTKHGLYGKAGRLSYLYVLLLFSLSFLFGHFYGIWGLVIASCVTELLMAYILVRYKNGHGPT